MQVINATDGIRITKTSTTAGLLSRVLWITTVGFLFTAFGAYISPEFMSGLGFGAVVVVTFILLFAIRFAAKRSPALGLAMFYVFTIAMGVEVGPLVKSYLHLANGQAIVFNAALTTAAGMAVMALVAHIVNFNYQKVGNYAIAALFGLIIVGFLGMFFHFVSPTVYSYFGLIIFSVLLLVDFMRLRDSPANSTPVFLALSIYLDALNIFLFLLQIFGNGGNRRDSKWS
ncbi:MAG: Bax inhibitor-1 family protein [Bryocella sp.]